MLLQFHPPTLQCNPQHELRLRTSRQTSENKTQQTSDSPSDIYINMLFMMGVSHAHGSHAPHLRRRTLAEQFPKNMLFPKDTSPQETSNHTLLNGCHLAHQNFGRTRVVYTGKQRVLSNKGHLFLLKHNQSQMTSSDE